MYLKSFAFLLASLLFFGQCQSQQKEPNKQASKTLSSNSSMSNKALITFGAGCFWCVEAVFQRIEGVHKVTSGYMGGSVANPTYKQICTGLTGHAEVCQLEYDPQVVSFEELLKVFFGTHDPTTLNRQGNDVGTQYRSAIFYHTPEQQRIADNFKKTLNAENVFGKPVVTEITAASTFYVAEDYHQNYYNENSSQGYCTYVIKPKLDKLEKVFADKLKK
jgi:peptide-methionine (S)-S-oxide reductase